MASNYIMEFTDRLRTVSLACNPDGTFSANSCVHYACQAQNCCPSPCTAEALINNVGQDNRRILSQDAQNVIPARPQASRSRRRTLRGTLRISTNRERSWGTFSASG